MSGDDVRDAVSLTNLEQPLFEGADATKRALVDVSGRCSRPHHPGVARPAAVRGPSGPRPTSVHAEERSQVRAVLGADGLAVGGDLETGGVLRPVQRSSQAAVVRQPTRGRVPRDADSHRSLGSSHAPVLDLDPPSADAFPLAVRAVQLVRQVLADVGLVGTVKTSGAKGVHVFVPIGEQSTIDDAAAAPRAIAARAERLDPALATTAFIREDRGGKVFIDSTRVGGATVIAAYSPRLRPGVPVSFPVAWDELDQVVPADFTLATVPRLLPETDLWANRMPEPQRLSPT